MRLLFSSMMLSEIAPTGGPEARPYRSPPAPVSVRPSHPSSGNLVRCLALNASFEPLTMVPVRRALRLVIEGKAEIVESDDHDLVRSASLEFPRPAIIRLVRFVHVPRRF